MKKYFILFILFFLLVSEVRACLFSHNVINNTTKECGIYYSQCSNNKGDIWKTVLPENWEIADASITNFPEYCKSIKYSFIEKNVPYKEVCCTWKATLFIFIATLITISLICLFLTKKNKKTKKPLKLFKN